MRGSYYGLVGAFLGAVAVPDRAIPTLAVTDPRGALTATAGIAAATWALLALAHATARAGLWGTPRRSHHASARGRRREEVAGGPR
jgi:hypothetical protein